jgi:hypothetical protein
MSGPDVDNLEPVLIVKLSRRLVWLDLVFTPLFLIGLLVAFLSNDFWNQQNAIVKVLIAGTFIIVPLHWALVFRWLRDPPVILECRSNGIQSRGTRFIPWEDMDYIDSNSIFGSMTFHMLRRSNISLNPFEAGYRQTKLAIEFVRKAAPRHLTAEL